LHDWACRLFGAEVFVKRDDAMYFGNRDIKYVGKNWDQFFADISGVVLHCVKSWQHATFNAGKLADNGFKFRERCVSTQGS
jgi:hypothetical protein